MTDTKSAPYASANPEVASGVAQFFTPVVHQLVALAVNGKQAHWHVRGHNFIEVHEYLDQVVEHAQDAADLAAERVIALGLPIDARLETVAKAGATSPKAGFKQADDTIADVVAQIDLATEKVNAAITGLAELDPASQDIAISIRQTLDKDRWFLSAHLSVN
ncbi:Dps family protein [Agromyces aerolatus]|uniref:Dps family protein n=1 Tax=Agromyces sp. LY-1074 TaxID=3074080 RepID=UPI00285521EB|nr:MULTISPECIES: DNA starvation/stationary phase protection protein [unclassified Agromyces]MDR5699867.1 DNA starvation/stationary phase protection protein [Agromyces sp. LY-1074]MDR5706321.1 DNA starvation/stationary phase protection protein [Agromyces sp. LY-1358]